MEESLHYLLMATHSSFQKILLENIKNTALSLGQPKVLDYLKNHDGAIQKDIAAACHIEPASLTSILNGMEKKELIIRKMQNGNRRSFHIFLTPNGNEKAKLIENEFQKIENSALKDFSETEKNALIDSLLRVYQNLLPDKSEEENFDFIL